MWIWSLSQDTLKFGRGDSFVVTGRFIFSKRLHCTWSMLLTEILVLVMVGCTHRQPLHARAHNAQSEHGRFYLGNGRARLEPFWVISDCRDYAGQRDSGGEQTLVATPRA